MAQAGVRGQGLRWPSAGFRREPVAAGLEFTLSLEGPGSSFSLATAFRFLATLHSPLLFTVDGRPSGRRPAARFHPPTEDERVDSRMDEMVMQRTFLFCHGKTSYAAGSGSRGPNHGTIRARLSRRNSMTRFSSRRTSR